MLHCYLISMYFNIYVGTAVAQWLRCCATNQKVAGSIPACVSGFFIEVKSFRSHYGPGVDSASNRNEYQEYFLRGKGGRCLRLTTLPPSCAVVMKSGNLNFLEPYAPLQACNGTALSFYLKIYVSILLTDSLSLTLNHQTEIKNHGFSECSRKTNILERKLPFFKL